MATIRKAIIPAAGLGTRFLPATKAQPKEMLPIVDTPAIQYIVEEAIASGIEDIIIVTGRNKRAIEDHFDKSVELEMTLEEKGKRDLLEMVRHISYMADIHYIRQKEPLGLGHAILCARKFVGNEPFAVLLGDDIIQSEPPCLSEMIRLYERLGTSLVAVQRVPWEDVGKYGIVSPTEELAAHQVPEPGEPGGSDLPEPVFVKDLVEKPARSQAPSNLAVMGRYILEPEIFSILEHCEPGSGGEIQLTDALRTLNRSKTMGAYPIRGRRYDVGDKLGYIEATIEYALRHPDLKADLTNYLLKLIEKQPELHDSLR